MQLHVRWSIKNIKLHKFWAYLLQQLYIVYIYGYFIILMIFYFIFVHFIQLEIQLIDRQRFPLNASCIHAHYLKFITCISIEIIFASSLQIYAAVNQHFNKLTIIRYD